MKTRIIYHISFVLLAIIFLNVPGLIFASITDGTIDSVYKYAWSEKAGWLNFGCSNCNVHITDSGLTGYVWSENYGWINLNPVTSGVKNNGEGNLSGYAWGENLGWIDFDNVSINANGVFSGTANSPIIGTINFNCSGCTVKTDWRPQSVRPACNNSLDDDGDGKIDYPNDPGCDFLTDTDETDPITEKIKELPKKITEEIKKVPEIIKRIPEVFKPKPPEEKLPEVPIEELVPKEVPLVFMGKWTFLTYTLENKSFVKFTLAPLPREFQKLAEKFPKLGKTFAEMGIQQLFDIEKLRLIKLTLPGLTERLGLPAVKIEPGKFALPQGVPAAKLSPAAKKQLPTEIVFARTGGELIDFNIALSITEKGELQQRITTISGEPLQLVVKPEKPVKSIKGYVVFKSKATWPTSLEPPLNSLLASLIFANLVFTKIQEQPVRVEKKLALLEFEYTDPDNDGIFTTEIQAPIIEGEYEIITVMDYESPELGLKEIRLILVVDPEGYIFERIKSQELRIKGAIVSLFWLNSETNQYELWPAKEYKQENPQRTDETGKYSFLVPPGQYYLKVEHPKYLGYQSDIFTVKEGSGIHINVELKTKYWWLKIVDWKVILLIVVILLLLYNFYRDKIRKILLKRTK